MADILTMQDLANGHLDVKALGEAANGDENTIVTTRTGNTYPSAERAIKTMFQNGGLPAVPFATKALMTASALIDGQYAMVTDDTVNNGLYVKTAGAWVKSGYDPLLQAKQEPLTTKQIDSIAKIDIFNGYADWTDDYYYSNTGVLSYDNVVRLSGYIAVNQGCEVVKRGRGEAFNVNIFDANKNFLMHYNAANAPSTYRHLITQPLAAYIRIVDMKDNNNPVDILNVKKSLDWLEVKPKNIYDAVSSLFAESNYPNLLDNIASKQGFYLSDHDTEAQLPYFSYYDYVAVDPTSDYIISYAAEHVGSVYDANKIYIGGIPKGDPDGGINHVFSLPLNAAYIRVNMYNDASEKSLRVNKLSIDLPQQTLSGWRNKRIYWFGTSIPAAQPHQNDQDNWSYANLSVHDLGGIIYNKCVPGSGIASYSPTPFTSPSSTINYQTSLVDKINTTLSPDLVVFDFGVNDYATSPEDIDAYDPLDPYDGAAAGTKTKIDTRNTATFIGAYNTIIDAMLAKNPSIKFCFITHFSDDNASPSFTKKAGFFAKMNLVIMDIAKYWSAPVLDLHNKTSFRNRNGFNSIAPAMPDNIHPASGDGQAVQDIRNIVRDFLISIA